jgi:hypothetical protein
MNKRQILGQNLKHGFLTSFSSFSSAVLILDKIKRLSSFLIWSVIFKSFPNRCAEKKCLCVRNNLSKSGARFFQVIFSSSVVVHPINFCGKCAESVLYMFLSLRTVHVRGILFQNMEHSFFKLFFFSSVVVHPINFCGKFDESVLYSFLS